eukprot:TRINITY_DN2833_c0_g2_i1.p2 TRINITY_DN2833_c0_g2~~TRINITY_DN2833_c0_g2_i1.p2  ORF type:complete len:148 (+),score=19.18 TRINITY_DN2833_c0_g2_i1:211-654(+)
MISKPINDPAEPSTLEAVKALFDQWRTTRPKRCKIPEYLWNEVRNLSKQYSYSQIASQLQISYQQLFSHLEEQGQEDPRDIPVLSQSHFVNARIPLTDPPQQHQWSLPSSSAILEIQGKDGISMKATGIHPQDFAPLLQVFLNLSSH